MILIFISFFLISQPQVSMLEREENINGLSVKVKQDLSLSHAGTVWDGALVLAYFLSINPQFAKQYLENKNVLELGSGTGLLGISCAAFNAKKITLTDLPEYIQILRDNAKMNINQEGKIHNSQVSVVPLTWGNLEHIESIGPIDTIIGSELAYDEVCISNLIKTISLFSQQNNNLKVVISYQKYENPARNLSIKFDQDFPHKKFKEVDVGDMHDTYQDPYIGILFTQ